MAFLIKKDFELLLKTEDISTILLDSNKIADDILSNSIDFALEYIRSKLQHRYDLSQVFINVNDFDIATTYPIGSLIKYSEGAYSNTTAYILGDRVSYNMYIYEATQPTTGHLPTDVTYWKIITSNNSYYYSIDETVGNLPDDTDYFSRGDNRNPLIKNYALYIAISNLMPHVQPRIIPDWIVDKMDMAQSHLKRVSDGKDTLLLPIYEDTDEGQNVYYSSETQKNWNY